MTALGTRFSAAVVIGIALVASLSVLASDSPDAFEASATEAGHTPDTSEAGGADLPAGVLVPFGLVLTGAATVAAARAFRVTPANPADHEG